MTRKEMVMMAFAAVASSLTPTIALGQALDGNKLDIGAGSSQRERGSSACYEPLHIFTKKGSAFSILSRPYENSPGPAIVIELTSSGLGILNPDSKEFPATTNLRNLTREAANDLFGRASDSGNGTKVFSLMYQSGTLEFRKKHLFFLETQFANDILVAYRVRGNGLKQLDWVKIEK